MVWSSEIQAHLKRTDFFIVFLGGWHHPPPNLFRPPWIPGSLPLPRCGNPELTGRTDEVVLCSVTCAWWWLVGVEGSPPGNLHHNWLENHRHVFKLKNILSFGNDCLIIKKICRVPPKSSKNFTGRWTLLSTLAWWCKSRENHKDLR